MWSSHSSKREVNFEDFNIIKTVKNSIYGEYEKMYSELFSNEVMNYFLPNIIIMGDESCEKLSLLNYFIDFPIITNNPKTRIKCTINLIIEFGDPYYCVKFNEIEIVTTKQNICSIVDNYMSTMENNIINDTLITILIREPSNLKLSIYILPEIRAFPKNIKHQSIEICKKYLNIYDNDNNINNNIIICTIPANTLSLTSCKNMALINKMGLISNTIVALTKVDEVQYDINNFLIDRILLKSNEFLNNSIYACVGIIDDVWINDNIILGLPEEFVDIKNNILNNLGAHSLLTKINELFNKHINTYWKPLILKKINDDLKSCAEENKVLFGEKYMPFYEFIELFDSCYFIMNSKYIVTDITNMDNFAKINELYYRKYEFLKKIGKNIFKNKTTHYSNIIYSNGDLVTIRHRFIFSDENKLQPNYYNYYTKVPLLSNIPSYGNTKRKLFGIRVFFKSHEKFFEEFCSMISKSVINIGSKKYILKNLNFMPILGQAYNMWVEKYNSKYLNKCENIYKNYIKTCFMNGLDFGEYVDEFMFKKIILITYTYIFKKMFKTIRKIIREKYSPIFYSIYETRDMKMKRIENYLRITKLTYYHTIINSN